MCSILSRGDSEMTFFFFFFLSSKAIFFTAPCSTPTSRVLPFSFSPSPSERRVGPLLSFLPVEGRYASFRTSPDQRASDGSILFHTERYSLSFSLFYRGVKGFNPSFGRGVKPVGVLAVSIVQLRDCTSLFSFSSRKWARTFKDAFFLFFFSLPA